MDLFKALQNAVGCAMLSDIKFDPYKTKACTEIFSLKLEEFPLSQYEELANYLFNESVKFDSYSDAEKYYMNKQTA